MKRAVKKIVEIFKSSKVLKPALAILLFWSASSFLISLTEAGKSEFFPNLFDALYWTVVTFSSTGYGDKYPVTVPGKLVAMTTILIGIAIIGFMSGSFASFFVERTAKARRGLMEFKKESDHLVICGWKEDMKDILIGIIDASVDLSAEKIMLVSNVEAEKIEALKEEPPLKAVKYVRGDYFSETALTRANVRQASKVLVLADKLESRSMAEVDSKTVMTVLAIKAISKTVYVCAEILDKKYESYLRQAQCDEILFSRDFSRQFLANTSAINGMAHIIHDILSQEFSHSRINTMAIPSEFINKTFKEFRGAATDPGRRILLGILENTGAPVSIKLESLREAQKTSDVSRLVANLQKVKEIEVNRPVLLPADDYVIQKHSLGIVLEKSL